MIIKCEKCETKFRFDEKLIAEDGVWVKCSRCRHVFHQDRVGDVTGLGGHDRISEGNPDRVPRKWIVSPEVELEHPQDTVGGEERDVPDIAKAAVDSAGLRDGVERKIRADDAILSRVDEIREAMEEKNIDFAVREFKSLEDLSGEEDGEPAVEEELIPEREGKKKSAVGRFFAWFLFSLIVLALLGGLYVWLFPQGGQQVARILSPYFPLMEKILGKEAGESDPLLGNIILQDIRQHSVNNWLMGNMRVIEGAAVNTGKNPLTRIQIRGRLYDETGAVLGEQASFCGNLLTDAELSTQTEEDIQRKLNLQQGSSVSNDRINPDGLIPFMIVFTHEPPGITKVTVVPAAAERLLQ